jgi:hypothetical protein
MEETETQQLSGTRFHFTQTSETCEATENQPLVMPMESEPPMLVAPNKY